MPIGIQKWLNQIQRRSELRTTSMTEQRKVGMGITVRSDVSKYESRKLPEKKEARGDADHEVQVLFSQATGPWRYKVQITANIRCDQLTPQMRAGRKCRNRYEMPRSTTDKMRLNTLTERDAPSL